MVVPVPPAPPVPGRATWPAIAPLRHNVVIVHRTDSLPDDGRQLLEAFDAERRAIQEDADRKLQERRDAVVKSLQDLQDQYTKAGRLDEAVAIRDFLKAGGPGSNLHVRIEKIEPLRKR